MYSPFDLSDTNTQQNQQQNNNRFNPYLQPQIGAFYGQVPPPPQFYQYPNMIPRHVQYQQRPWNVPQQFNPQQNNFQNRPPPPQNLPPPPHFNNIPNSNMNNNQSHQNGIQNQQNSNQTSQKQKMSVDDLLAKLSDEVKKKKPQVHNYMNYNRNPTNQFPVMNIPNQNYNVNINQHQHQNQKINQFPNQIQQQTNNNFINTTNQSLNQNNNLNKNQNQIRDLNQIANQNSKKRKLFEVFICFTVILYYLTLFPFYFISPVAFEYDYNSNFKRKRMKRFDNDQVTIDNYNTPVSIQTLPDEPIIGTCMDIEKEYYRMQDTDISKIRPEYILKKSLKHLENLWNTGEMEYLSICNQMKSIRQDLTVQQIKNEFAVKVYESHARIALENSDFSEFNQCQTQLKSLYEINEHQEHEMEFTAYRILYKLYDSAQNHALLLHDIQTLTKEQRDNEYVKHALRTCSAYYSNNFYKFFSLYKTAPNLGKSVINLHIETVRKTFLKTLNRSYKEPLDLQWISNRLAFENISTFKSEYKDSLHIIKRGDKEYIDLKKSNF